MKKILDLLEQKIQWIVLAIGLGYVCYVAYAFLVVPPVFVTVDGAKVGPGDVDKKIYDTRIYDLEQKLRKPVAVTLPPQHSFSAEFRDSMTYKTDPAAPIAASSALWPQTVLKFSPAELPRGDISALPNGPGGHTTVADSDLVTALPDLSGVKARIADSRTGMSFVLPPDVKADAAAATPVDKTWVTVRYEIDPAAMAKAWDERKIPDSTSNTSFLQVVLERQEKKSDGTWGATTPVPPLSFSQLQTMPEANSLSPDTRKYKEWAAQHQPEIIQPGFYNVAKGDGWAPPGIDVPNAAGDNQPKFDPKQYIAKTPAELAKLNLTNEQKQAIARERDKARPKQPGRSVAPAAGRGRAAPPPSGGIPRPGPGDFGPLDPDRPVSYQARGAQPPPPAILPPSGADADVGPPPGSPATPAAPTPTTPGAPIATKTHYEQYPPPTSEFDPHKWAADHATHPLIVGWAHDETVEPGHVYRYRITYRVKNPVFFSNSSVRDPKLADVFYLAGPAGDWSDEVEVSSPVSFWLVRAGINNSSVSVKVFRRQEGAVKAKVFDVVPGDPIGGKDGDVDYSTDWTLVDVRKDSRSELFALLMDKFGLLYRRDLKTDSSDPKFLELNSLASSSASAAP